MRLHPLLIYNILALLKEVIDIIARAEYSSVQQKMSHYAAAFELISSIVMLTPTQVQKQIYKCLTETLGSEEIITVESIHETAKAKCNDIISTYTQWTTLSQKEVYCTNILKDHVKATLNCVINALHGGRLLTFTSEDIRILELMRGMTIERQSI